MKILDHVLVPVASEDDARATCEAVDRYLDGLQRITAVHVIEKAGGAPDKAPLAKRREDAAEFLATFESCMSDTVAVDTRTVYGTDIVEAISREATEVGATAIAFRPRGGSRILRLITGDTATRLTIDPDVPVISLPEPDGH